MPSMPHLVLGGVFAICLYYISNKRFTKHHVFILFMNNLFGPDAGWVLGVGNYTHTLFGSIFFSLFLAVLYHYITRFSIKLDSLKEIEIMDLEETQLSYVHVYFVVLGGNIMHNYLDGIINGGGNFKIFPNIGSISDITWSIADLMALGDEGIIQFNTIISFAIAMVLYLGFIITFTYFIKKNTIKEASLVIMHVVAFCLIFYLFGENATTFHSDYGAIIYISLFWLIPMILCTLSVKDFKFLKKKKKKTRQIIRKESNIALIVYLVFSMITIGEAIGFLVLNDFIINWIIEAGIIDTNLAQDLSLGINSASIVLMIIGTGELVLWLKIRSIENYDKNLIIISIWMLIGAGALLAIAILTVLFNQGILAIILAEFEEEVLKYFTLSEIRYLMIIIQTLLITLGMLELMLGIGLALKNEKAWKATIYYNLAFSFTIIGIIVACFLSENTVKRSFDLVNQVK